MGNKFGVKWNLRKLANFSIQEIYDEHHGDVTCEIWVNDGQLTSEEVHNINWEALKKATKQLPFQRRVWLTKHITGITGVNYWKHKWGQTPHEVCPICLDATETSKHIILCRDQRVQDCWQNTMGKLELHLEKIQTPPILMNTIIQQLQRWRNPNYRMMGEQDDTVIVKQQSIGWQNLLFGRLAPIWTHRHADHIPSENQHKSKRWTIQLIKKLWDVSWDLWEHRNGIQHSEDHPWRIIEKQTLAAAIREQFRIGITTLARRDHSKLQGRPEDVLQFPFEQQQLWLNSILAARAHFAHAQRNNDGSETQHPDVATMRSSIHDWLHRSF